jgi:hypothetical protein
MRTYRIVSRYFEPEKGWITEEETLDLNLGDAWRQASNKARMLDEAYSDSHFWTVDVKNPEGNSYVQLFHGRLS